MLIAWLGVTYLHKVPSERYNQQGRSSSPATVTIAEPASEMMAGVVAGNR